MRVVQRTVLVLATPWTGGGPGKSIAPKRYSCQYFLLIRKQASDPDEVKGVTPESASGTVTVTMVSVFLLQSDDPLTAG